MLRFVLLMWITLSVTLTTCTLAPPSESIVSDWLPSPPVGSEYSYTVATTWHDGSVSIGELDYVVSRVAESEGRALVKLTGRQHMVNLFWIADPDTNTIHESQRSEVSPPDLVLVRLPVLENSTWVASVGGTAFDYRIVAILRNAATNVGRVDRMVMIELRSAALPETTIAVQWSPDLGLIRYTETYARGSSYVRKYERVLVRYTTQE